VTTHASKAPGDQAIMQVHLKKNFQYRNRGSKYDLPPPKMNHAKGGGSSSIVLREDQLEWERGVRQESIRVRKEEKRLQRAMEEKEKTGGQVWNDPDWLPDLLVGTGHHGSKMPVIGHGRRNPNENRKKKK
jgi:RNA-binding protein NOB1